MRFSIKILAVVTFLFLLTQSASATVNVGTNQSDVVNDTGYNIYCSGWTCSQLVEVIPNGDTVINYGHVVEANDKGYTDLVDFLFTNCCNKKKAKEVAPECYAQEGWTCSQLTEIIPNGNKVIDFGDVQAAYDKGYNALGKALFDFMGGDKTAKDFAPKCYATPSPTPTQQPIVGFQITGVQAVTATMGAIAIAGAALYYVRYLR